MKILQDVFISLTDYDPSNNMSDNNENDELMESLRGILTQRLNEKRYIVRLHENLLSSLRAGQTEEKYALRGKNAFQTDVLISKRIDGDNNSEDYIPMIAIELKTGQDKHTPTTHDIMLYSVKANKHKIIYPYLRYGMIWFNGNKVPRRFIINNEHMDFAYGFSVDWLKNEEEIDTFLKIIREQLNTSEETLKRIDGKNKELNIFSIIVKYDSI